MAQMVVTIKLEDLPKIKRYLQMLEEILNDGRIAEPIRDEYQKKLKTIMNETEVIDL